ncbi:MAG: hypothetical protein WBN36_08210 [Gammaproteobacteria bacterium]
MAKRQRGGLGGWLFLGIVLLGYGLSFMLSPESTAEAFTFFRRIMRQVLPVLGMVFLLLYIANLLLTPSTVKRYLGKEAGIKGWIASIVAGIFSMGPIYAWYTALAELQQKGMRTALVATFLYSRAVKIPLLPLMIYYFGPGYTIVLCLYLLVFSVVNGFLTERLMHHKT